MEGVALLRELAKTAQRDRIRADDTDILVSRELRLTRGDLERGSRRPPNGLGVPGLFGGFDDGEMPPEELVIELQIRPSEPRLQQLDRLGMAVRALVEEHLRQCDLVATRGAARVARGGESPPVVLLGELAVALP